jgi:tetratricopeptide (TPR) repeat protein
MAKKLNKKIVVILLVIAGLGALGMGGLGFYYLRERDPEHCLRKAEAALERNDYKTAERYFGRACGVAKSNQEKIANFFRFSEFQLMQNEHHEPDWPKALGCWSAVLKIDPKHPEALRKLFDYFYEIADLGQSLYWKQVQEYAEKLLEVEKEKNLTADPLILSAHGRAVLEIARSGGTTNRQELLDQAVADFQNYIKLKPTDIKGYEYLADCSLVQGDIEASRGNLQGQQTARQKAEEVLKQAVEAAEDKPAAWAATIEFELETLKDPNRIDSIRAEVETLTKTLPPSGRLYLALSAAYEQSSGLNRAEELAKAVAAVRQAVALEPENVRYAIRLATLLHRLGSISQSSKEMEEALQIAEASLNLPDAQDKPGPRQYYSRANQYGLLSLIAQIHIEQILETPQPDPMTAETKKRLERVKSTSDKIAQIVGSQENPTIQKWQGLITLAEGQRDKAIRQLYKAYEQSKALDLPNQVSQIDSYLCYTLAGEMARQNVFGMQKEFLEKAIFNRTSIAAWKPQSILEYAKILILSRSFPQAAAMIGAYERAKGSTPETQQMRLQVYIEAGLTQEAEELLSKMDPASSETMQFQLSLASRKVGELMGRINAEEDPAKIESLRAERLPLYETQFRLFSQLLAKDPALVDPTLLHASCQRWIQEDQADKARQLVNAYLGVHPGELSFLILQKHLEQPDPKSIPSEQMRNLTRQAIEQVADPKIRILSLAQYHQSANETAEALTAYQKAYEQYPEDIQVVLPYYEFLLNQKSFDQAEKITKQSRDKNLDGCEGNFFAAQLEMARQDLPLALRKLDECLTYRPLFPQAWLLKSRIFYSQNDLQAALEAAQKAATMNPLSPDIILHYASLVHERNVRLGNRVTDEQSAEAERLLLFALILNPNNRNLQSFYAEIMYEKDPEKSLAMRQQLLRREPSVSNAVLLGNMAMRMAQDQRDTAKQKGLYQVAEKAYQQALTMAPDNEGVLNAYSEYMRLTGQSRQAETMLGTQPDVLWRFYLRDGQYDKAETLLENLRKEKPEDLDLLRGLILVAQGKGDRTALRRYLDALLPLSKGADDELWVLQRYLEFEFTDTIEKQIASFRERYPDNTYVLLLEAWLQMSRGKLQDAMAQVNQFLSTNQDHAGAWRLRGRIYRLIGDYPKAIESLLQSKTLDPIPVCRIELANVYLENGQLEAAIGELRTALNEPQAPMQIRSMLEGIYEKRNRVNDLRIFYKETLEKYPDSVYWHFRAGKFAYDQKDYPTAEAMLSKAWELSRKQGPGDARTLDYYLEVLLQSKAYNKLLAFAAENIDSPHAAILYTYTAQTHLELGQKEKAAQNFFQAMDKVGTNIDLMNGIVSIIVDKTGPDTVVQWCQQKLSQDKKSLPGLLAAINLYTLTGQYNQALQYMDTCLELLNPQQMEWVVLSLKKANLYTMAYAQTSDEEYFKKSLALMEEIVTLMPQNYTAMNNLAYLLADSNQQLDKALEYSRKACQNDLGNPVFLDTYAYIQCLLGNYEDAHQSLLRTIQLHEAQNEPIPWEVHKHMGMAQEGMKKIPEALAAYRRAIETAGIPAKEKETLDQKIRELIES